MQEAFDANRPDVLAMRRRAEQLGRRAVALATLGLLVAVPVAAQGLATPFIAVAAILLVIASGDVRRGAYRHARRRLLLATLSIALAQIAWVPAVIEDEAVSVLLLFGPPALVLFSLAAMAAGWAREQVAAADETELKRARIREQRAIVDGRGRAHEVPGSLTREEIRALAEERAATGRTGATPGRGTPDHVSLADERHPRQSPAQRAVRKEYGDREGSLGPAPDKKPPKEPPPDATS